ncbi:MAG: MBL fold metallo-hydrolase [Alphaproteobacteria bacterium]
MGRIIAILVVVLAALAGVAYVFQKDIGLWIFERALSTRLGADPVAALPDGLHVGLCGAGSPLADPRRSGPCVTVIAGKTMFVVDSGSGAARTLTLMGLSPGQVSRVFLTHFHSDHIDGLGELMTLRWAQGNHKTPLPVAGPEGVTQVVDGFNTAYDLDRGYRVAHHGETVVPPSGGPAEADAFQSPPDGEDVTVYDQDGITVTAFKVDHFPVTPAVGYRFEYGGRSLVISGDTKKSPNLERFAKGADLLAHEALSFRLVGMMNNAADANGLPNVAKIALDIMDYHTSPVQAAQSAAAAGVDHLLFYHIVPALPLSALERAFTDGVEDVYDGPYTVGRDGTFISLPAGTDEIKVSNRL